MTDKITYRQVTERIESTAKEIVSQETTLPKMPSPEDFDTREDWSAECYDAWESFQGDLEALQDEAYDKAHTEVDSWDWSIYTYQGFQVYDCLPSDEQTEAEGIFDELGGYEYAAEAKQGPYEIGCSMAVHWIENALADAIRNQCEELIEMSQNQLENL